MSEGFVLRFNAYLFPQMSFKSLTASRIVEWVFLALMVLLAVTFGGYGFAGLVTVAHILRNDDGDTAQTSLQFLSVLLRARWGMRASKL